MNDFDPVATRRTFAIIPHPEAGKTTLTERLLLFGVARHLDGAPQLRPSISNMSGAHGRTLCSHRSGIIDILRRKTALAGVKKDWTIWP
jgi:hypothetical protein